MNSLNNSLVNGQFDQNISVNDRGLQYGDGLFETMLVHNDKIPLWQKHLGRLMAGCQQLQIAAPTVEQLQEDTQRLLKQWRLTQVPQSLQQTLQFGKQKQNQQLHAVIKIVVTRGSGQRGYRYANDQPSVRIVSLYPYPDYPISNWQQGVELFICQTPVSQNAVLAGIKHLNRLENVLARNEWQDPDIAEGLMLDQQGRVIEATMSNVFAINQGELQTPDLEFSGVNGIMRQLLIQLATELKISTKIKNFSLQDIMQADELLVCNSVLGIWPVRKINHTLWTPGNITKKLQRAVDERLA